MPRLKKKWMQPVVEATTPAPVAIAPAFLNIEQAATYFGVTTWTIRRLVSTGKLAAKQIGKRFTIKRTDLDRLWESEKAVAPKAVAA